MYQSANTLVPKPKILQMQLLWAGVSTWDNPYAKSVGAQNPTPNVDQRHKYEKSNWEFSEWHPQQKFVFKFFNEGKDDNWTINACRA